MSLNIVAPSAGESITEIEISKWNVSDGAWVKKDQVIALAETEKATLDIHSPVSGKVKILAQVGAIVSPGTPVASIEEGEDEAKDTSKQPEPTKTESPPPPKPELEVAQESPQSSQGDQKLSSLLPTEMPITADISNAPIYASPSVRKMIVESNTDITELLKLQGGDSSITEKDVEAFLVKSRNNTIIPSSSTKIGSRETSSRKMTRLRQTISKRLVNAQHTAALLTTFNEIDMGEVIAIRNQYKELFKKKHEVGLGFMSFFIKAVCHALIEFPIINSMLEDDMVIEHKYVDVGIAVATPKGLVVPVIRNAESLSFKEIEKVIGDYGKQGKEGGIQMDDLIGGTFTITNGGTFGSMLSTPIINPPQSAILGMHNIIERPVVKNGEIVIRPVMYVALTYDHRLIDGADSVRFLYRIKEFIEDPHRLLVGI